MKYVHVPRELTSNDVRAEDYSFSAGHYVRFVPPINKTASDYLPLDQLVTVRDEPVHVNRRELYRYAEIGDIDVTTGGITFRDLRGWQLPTPRPARAEHGDVLISTVRTYRKGIGYVLEAGANIVTTNALLTLSGVTEDAADAGVTLPYVYAFLRSNFFTEQVWSLLNRGVYPRMDTGALNRITLPIAQSEQTCRYVAALALAIAEKELSIRTRSDAIQAAIDHELRTNQKLDTFVYQFPTRDEVVQLRRIDAAIYSREYRSKIWLIQNYRRGSRTPTETGFSITPGPSLEIKILRTRIDSAVPKPGFYTLLIPANISEYGTMSSIVWMGTGKSLPLLRPGDILFGEAGFQKGRSLVLIDGFDKATTNAHGLYARRSDNDLTKSIFFRCIFNWYRSERLIDLMAVGGSGGHFSPEYFDFVLIPNFPEELQAGVARMYHSPAEKPAKKLTLTNFVEWHREWNQDLGIWELDREMKALQLTLSLVQERVIAGKTVTLPEPLCA
jgi:hypothetical protein